jgi:hypothetical protein
LNAFGFAYHRHPLQENYNNSTDWYKPRLSHSAHLASTNRGRLPLRNTERLFAFGQLSSWLLPIFHPQENAAFTATKRRTVNNDQVSGKVEQAVGNIK